MIVPAGALPTLGLILATIAGIRIYIPRYLTMCTPFIAILMAVAICAAVMGNPHEEIVNAAKQIGAVLIVIGSHGYTGLGRLLLGSTADRVLQYAPCPTLVVKDLVRPSKMV